MHIERRSLQFNHLLAFETQQLRTDWQEGVFILEDVTLALDIYKNGPIFFSVEEVEGESKFGAFTYYLPLNEAITLEDETDFRYKSSVTVNDALVLRQAEQEVDFHAAYDKIKNYAGEHDILIEDNFYVVLIEVYGDIIIDLYVPIKSEAN